VKPGWKQAHASILTDAVMEEASRFAEQTQEAYTAVAASGVDITAAAWEQLMGMVIATSQT
jgi:hypothetical protein